MKFKGFIFLFMLASTGQAWAKDPPRFVRVTFTQDSTTGVNITWNTDRPQTDTMVEYGKTTAYGRFVRGSVFMANGDLKATHEAKLAGLEPDTLYHYRVGAANDWSRDHTFRTTPADVCTPFAFVALGDDRSDDNYGPSNKWHPILDDAIENEHPYFAFNTGDIVMKGKDVGQWINLLKASSPSIADTPLMACLGNHDVGPSEGDAANYNQVFNFPRNDVTNTEDFYFFTTANAIFVSLSTETYRDGDPKFSMQAKWLDKVLTDHPKMWKFVFFHRPCYTSHGDILGKNIGHPPNEVGQNKAFTAVFDKHHVDIVFNGHNHWYERIGPLRGNGDAAEGIPVDDPSKGTIYIITGGAGAITYQSVLSLFCPGTPGSKVCFDQFHYVALKIDYNHLDVTAWRAKQQLLGYSDSNRKQIDHFVIDKAVPDADNPCLANADEQPVPDRAEKSGDQGAVETNPEDESIPDLAPGPTAEELQYAAEPRVEYVERAETEDILESMTDAMVDGPEGDRDAAVKGDKNTHHAPSGGCTTGHRPVSAALLFLLALALLFLRRQKRGC